MDVVQRYVRDRFLDFFEKERERRERKVTDFGPPALPFYPVVSLAICKQSAYAAAVEMLVRHMVERRGGAEIFSRDDIPRFGLSSRALSRGLKEGLELGLWDFKPGHPKPYRLIARHRIMKALGIVQAGPRRVLSIEMFGNMRVLWRYFYAALLTDGEWYRDTLISITGKSLQSLLRAERELGIDVKHNIVLFPLPASKEETEEFVDFTTSYRFYAVTKKGRIAKRRNGDPAFYRTYEDALHHSEGVNGEVVLASQLHNTYSVDFTLSTLHGSGRARWLSYEVRSPSDVNPSVNSYDPLRPYYSTAEYIKRKTKKPGRIYQTDASGNQFWMYRSGTPTQE